MSEANENPYVGPRPFDEEDATRGRYHGREHEARDLLALVSRERLVLFYSQSGAGKSSLLRASLLPGLRQLGFDVLPIARVSGARPGGAPGTTGDEATNPIVYNVILSLNEGLSPDARSTPDALLHVSLSEFLGGEEVAEPAAAGAEATHTVEPLAIAAANGTINGTMSTWDKTAAAAGGEGEADDAMAPTVLVIDQFEEIVTVYPNRWQERRAFFEQLRAAMERLPRLWVVLALREDYVASLEPYAELMPNRLRARYYMQRMGVEAALEAVRKPAEKFDRPFAPGVAEKLVDNLRRVRVQFAGELELGQYVEPVQLQVVCYELWEQVTRRAAQDATAVGAGCVIDERDLTLDYIDQALTRYYQSALAFTEADATVQRLGIDEGQLRTWFDREIITESGIRNSVLRNEQTGLTGSLPNVAVDWLLGRYLLRAELRAGGSWVELVHDRFVEPIRADNALWFPQHLSALQRQAALWQDEDRQAGLLLQGEALADAEQWAAAYPNDVKQVEREFLKASQEARSARERELRQALRIRWLALAAIVLSVFAIAAAIWATHLRDEALQSEQRAVEAKQKAQQAEWEAQALTTLMQSRQLVSEAEKRVRAGEYDVGLLMAVEASAITDSVEAASVLNLALRSPIVPDHVTYLPAVAGMGVGVEWNGPETRLLVNTYSTPGMDGPTLHMLDASDGRDLLQIPDAVAWEWNPNRTKLATASSTGAMAVWDTQAPRKLTAFEDSDSGVAALTWSADERSVLSVDNKGNGVVWDAASGVQVKRLAAAGNDSVRVETSPDTGRILGVSDSGKVLIWDIEDGGELRSLLPAQESVVDATWTGKGAIIATQDVSGTLTLWDAEVAKPLHSVQTGMGAWDDATEPPWSNTPGTRVVTRNMGVVQIWNTETGEILQSIPEVMWYEESGDERRLAVYFEGRAGIWDITTGAQMLSDKGSKDVDLDKTGARVATVEADGIHIYTLPDEVELQHVPVRSDEINWVDWQAASGRLAIMYDDDRLQLWDPRTSEIQGEFTLPENMGWTLRQSSDGARIVTTLDTGAVTFWRLTDTLPRLTHVRQATGARWDEKKGRVLTWSKDGAVEVWDAGNGKRVQMIQTGITALSTAEYNRDWSRIAAAGDGKLSLWDALSGKQLMGVQDVIQGCDWSRYLRDIGKGIIVYTSSDNVLHVHDSSTGAEMFRIPGSGDCTISEESKAIAIWSSNAPVRIMDAGTGSLIHETTAITQPWYAQWMDGGTKLAARNADGMIVWDAKQAKETYQGSGGVGWSPNGEQYFAQVQGGVELRRAEGGRAVKQFPIALSTDYPYVDWSPDGSHAAALDQQGTVHVWNISTGEEILLPDHAKRRPPSSMNYLFQAQWSGDQSRILTRDFEGVLRAWDADKGRLLSTYARPLAEDMYTDINETGTIVMIEGNSRPVFWNVDAGREILRLEDIRMSQLDEGWRRLLVLTDGTVRIVPIGQDDMRQMACDLAARNMSWLEWRQVLPGTDYRPTCAGKPIPPDAVGQVRKQAIKLFDEGETGQARRMIGQLNAWLRAANQFGLWGIDYAAIANR